MNITKRPLAERLNRLDSGLAAHPEYIPSLIDSVKTAKLATRGTLTGNETVSRNE